ncbi:MAG: FHA domain-containing protein [Myxococcales bacterium]|nr:FHA domain-containing protein [Myxococcales bacterium]
MVTVGVDVRLAVTGVEQEHAEVERRESGHYVLRDLGSSSGTFVNGARIEGEVLLDHGGRPSVRQLSTS